MLAGMTAASRKKAAGAAANTDIDVRFRLRVARGSIVAIGPGKVALLAAIRDEGSISAAARRLGMSYRRAWLLIDELNRSLVAPATHSGQGGQHGGGSALTPVGERVLALYREIDERAAAAAAKQIAELTALLDTGPAS